MSAFTSITPQLEIIKNLIFRFSDNQVYDIGATPYTLIITPPNSVIQYTFDITSDIKNTSPDLPDISKHKDIIPSNLGMINILSDGIYQITLHLTGAYPDDNNCTKQLNALVDTQLLDCLMKYIAQLARTNCNCNNEVNLQSAISMWMQLELVKKNLDCGNLLKAQEIFATLQDFCNNCQIGC